jgi:hypothetical protein
MTTQITRRKSAAQGSGRQQVLVGATRTGARETSAALFYYKLIK